MFTCVREAVCYTRLLSGSPSSLEVNWLGSTHTPGSRVRLPHLPQHSCFTGPHLCHLPRLPHFYAFTCLVCRHLCFLALLFYTILCLTVHLCLCAVFYLFYLSCCSPVTFCHVLLVPLLICLISCLTCSSCLVLPVPLHLSSVTSHLFHSS